MWNDGYVSEIDYVFGYFPEISLPRLKFALLAQGVGHNVGTSPNYLELGFGQGLTLAINAATSSGNYYGTDFNPSQAANAIRFAEATGKPIEIFDQSFEQLAERTDLPEFDVIALHGIWSWVSDSARESILRIINEKLRPGGIVYVSHNVIPGWAPFTPLRTLLREHDSRAGAGNLVDRINGSLAFAQQISDLGVGYFGAHPAVPNWLKTMQGQDRNYLAHEYFNASWRPESFSDLSDKMAQVKLGFGASSNILENASAKYMAPEVRALLDGIEDATLRELTSDFLVNRKFRTDIFVKGGHALSANEQWDEMCRQSFVRPGFVATTPTELASGFGKVDLRADLFEPIARFMDAADGHVASFAELCGVAEEEGMSGKELIEIVTILVGTGYLTTTTDSDTIPEDFFASLRFNREICRQARYGGKAAFLAAAGIGAGIKVDRLQLLILHAMGSGYEDIADYVLETLERQGEVLGNGELDIATTRDLLNEAVVYVRQTLLPMLERVGAVASSIGNPFEVDSIERVQIDPMVVHALENGGLRASA